jgi:hypothetical protein
MGRHGREHIERAFRQYWRTGAVCEAWDRWVELFTEDALYVDHVLGTFRGRASIGALIDSIVTGFGERYAVYEWHIVDEERDRVVFYMQNRRDHPSGSGTIDFPGVAILQYAGDGRWSHEEDFWSLRAAQAALREYRDACARFDPEHPTKRTRLHWGAGPDWTRGAPSHAKRPPGWLGRAHDRANGTLENPCTLLMCTRSQRDSSTA